MFFFIFFKSNQQFIAQYNIKIEIQDQSKATKACPSAQKSLMEVELLVEPIIHRLFSGCLQFGTTKLLNCLLIVNNKQNFQQNSTPSVTLMWWIHQKTW